MQIELCLAHRLKVKGAAILRFQPGLNMQVSCIPEFGPHLVFIMMFSKGLIPFSILLTSSIVQDGHGMLPLLAHSRRAFLIVKLINLLVGLLVGSVLMATGH